MRTCIVEECERVHDANGYCKMHYKRIKRNGTIDLIREKDLLARFEKNYIPEPNTGCWLWIGYGNEKGYGRMSVNGCMESAHRLSWIIHNGPIPEGMCVLHKCDVPSCVNPDHLFLGTYKDNMQDCKNKGRNGVVTGEKHHNAKFKWSDIHKIRQLNTSGTGYKKLAKKYNVAISTIKEICKFRAWKPETEPSWIKGGE